jgi:hypothetical protein
MSAAHPSVAAVQLPGRMKDLPLNKAGYPVPWFVAWFDGEPDFRVMDGNKLLRAVTERRCWLCGQRMTNPTAAFVIGPMCAVNRTSAEPPSHVPCAEYAAKACPFLANPAKRRRENNKPTAVTDPAGIMIARNPGVTLVWPTRRWSLFDDGRGGVLFDIGEPTRALWYAEGRAATRDEVVASIQSGLPTLAEMAKDDGPDACAELERRVGIAMELVPA